MCLRFRGFFVKGKASVDFSGDTAWYDCQDLLAKFDQLVVIGD